jgi:hypothetical protein
VAKVGGKKKGPRILECSPDTVGVAGMVTLSRHEKSKARFMVVDQDMKGACCGGSSSFGPFPEIQQILPEKLCLPP